MKTEINKNSALITKLASEGGTKASVIEALEATGMTTKQATVTLNFISEMENIQWRGKGAQGWRELMTAELKANPKMTAEEFKTTLDTEFPKIKESRRVEYTRYYFDMMSDLVNFIPKAQA